MPDQHPDDSGQAVDVEEILRGLAGLRYALSVLQQQVDQRVLVARDLGASWSAIGTALGVDKSSAFRRFRHLHDVELGAGSGPGVRVDDGQEQLLMPDHDRTLDALERSLEDRGV